MTVEKTQDSSSSGAGCVGDQFPAGMRVLAVDDSRACLKVLETLLRRCQYHVTTTNQAVTALKLLRENKDEFDIVISDVHMPDMDGFKLLELVGLEMDLPVIMLSANDDTKSVMKGITHGACDYLVKPVRIKELKNIWQHVIRRRKFDNRGRNNCHRSCGATSNQANTDAGEDHFTSGLPDWNEKLNRKRKDQYLEEEFDSEENGQENEDASTQKKQRVIWTGALHRKFVDAVNLLGIDKAVPKKILELMAGENLTRENVASHLQKYRQLLKKISTATSQQENVFAFGGYGQLPTLASIQQGGRLRSLNGATSFVFPGLASHGIVQKDHAHKNANIPTDFRTLPYVSLSRIQQANLGQGMPAFETNQLQQCKPMIESNNAFTSCLFDVKSPPVNSNHSFFDATNNRQLLEQQQKEPNGIGINTFDRLTPLCSDSLGMNTGVSSHLPDLGEYTETWGGADCMMNNFPSLENLPHFIPPASDVGCNLVSSNSAVASLLSDPTTGRDLQIQASSFSDEGLSIPISTYKSQLSDVGNIGDSNQRPDQIRKPNFSFNYSSNCMRPNDGLMDAVDQCGGFRSGVSNHKASSNMTDQLNFGSTFFKQNYDVEKSTAYGQTKFMDDYNSFENLLGALVKQDRESISLDGDNGSDYLFN